MDYNNLIQLLFCYIPEIKELYRKEMEWYGDDIPGRHVEFGVVVNPFLEELLWDDLRRKNKDVLLRLFDFFENMAKCEDVRVQEVLAFTVLERLGDSKELLNKAYGYMNECTKKLSNEVESFWGRNI